MNPRFDFNGDVRAITTRQYVESHLELFRGMKGHPLCRHMTNLLRECLRADKADLGVLLVMTVLMDAADRTNEAIDLLSPLSGEVGAPVALDRRPGP